MLDQENEIVICRNSVIIVANNPLGVFEQISLRSARLPRSKLLCITGST